MNKETILAELRQARTGHIRWRTYAQSIVNAPNHLDDIEEKAPVCHTECKFGRWYFSNLESLGDIDGFNEIDPLHELLHQTYSEIFAVMSQKDSSGTLARLLGSKNRHLEKKMTSVRALLEKLEETSRQLLTALDKFEDEIKKLPEIAEA